MVSVRVREHGRFDSGAWWRQDRVARERDPSRPSSRGLVACLLCGVAVCLAPAAAEGNSDRRHFEMVSPAEKAGNDVGSESGTIQAATSGERVVYLSATPFPGAQGSGMGNQYLGSRSTRGWTAESLTPRQDPNAGAGTIGAKYDAFTGELTAGVLQALAPVLVPGALDGPFMSNRYLRTFADPAGVYRLITVPPPSTPFSMTTDFGGAGSDLTRVFFESTTPFTADAPLDSQPQAYVWSASGLRYVGVLPDGSASGEGSWIGRGAGIPAGLYTSAMRSVAADGSSAVVSTGVSGILSDAHLYLWNDGRPSLDVSRSRAAGAPVGSGRGRFEIASSDHRRVFFTSGERLTDDATATLAAPDLYLYERDGDDLTDLTVADAAGAGVLGVLGASDDGSRVYFAATGALAAGGVSGASNLYLWTAGSGIRYITELPEDGNWDWLRAARRKSSRVSASGERLMFTSAQRLTASDNAGLAQVYVFDVDAGLSCASCRQDGLPSRAAATAITSPAAAQLLTGYLPRAFSLDGRRAFFNTAEDLVDEDTDGRVDVYEFDVDTGSVDLISKGTPNFDARFGDASASGDDVFFTTRQRLSGWDRDENLDLYAARFAGSPLPEPPPAIEEGCEGAPCQGPVTARPPRDVPGSAVFAGPGDANGDPVTTRLPTFAVTSISQAQRRRIARTGELTLTVRVSDAGRVVATVRGRVGTRTRTVASATRTALGGSVVKVPLRLSRGARAQLRRRGALRLDVRVRYSAARGVQRTQVTVHSPVRGDARRRAAGGAR